jgi:RNA polymerase sigma-70 factor (ECF subfamily)
MSFSARRGPGSLPEFGAAHFSHENHHKRGVGIVFQQSSSDAKGLPQPELVAAIPRLRRYARVLTGDANRADDLVQDTLARAWEKRHLWREGSDLRAWLFTIMHNVHVNQVALARRDAANVSLDADGGAAWQPPVRANQLDRVELMEIAEQLANLSADQREVLMLAAVEEMRYEDIANVLSIPIGTVMSRLSRARDKLRRLLGEPASSLRIVK